MLFDAGLHFKGVSLNEALLQGPDFVNALLGVLGRFRKDPISLYYDIEKMFNQLFVTEEHRNFLSFLWFDDRALTKKPSTYRITVHIFGAVSSPGVANYDLLRTADDDQEEFGRKLQNSSGQVFKSTMALLPCRTRPKDYVVLIE